MPEGDTVWRTANRLNQVFAGEELVLCDLRWPEIATVDFAGRRTREVVARGKHILHRLDDGWTIHSHLRMEGSWRIERTETPPRRHPATKVRAVLATATYTAVAWSLGMLDVVPTAEEHTLVGHLGPDILGPDWDPEAAVAHLRASRTTIGAALLDQRNLAGIGTMWAAESLFLERVNPFEPAAELEDADLRRLVARAHRLRTSYREHAMPTSTGIRRHGQSTYCHGRANQPCRRCGTPIRIEMVGPATQERTLFHCPTCQGTSASKPNGNR